MKVVVCFVMGCMFLLSGFLLPLGDFSLMRDIPKMYHIYQKVVDKDESGIDDFIGDYLLHGKDLLDHNKHDKLPKGGIHFQHQANFMFVVLLTQAVLALGHSALTVKDYFSLSLSPHSSEHPKEHFRPPLA